MGLLRTLGVGAALFVVVALAVAACQGEEIAAGGPLPDAAFADGAAADDLGLVERTVRRCQEATVPVHRLEQGLERFAEVGQDGADGEARENARRAARAAARQATLAMGECVDRLQTARHEGAVDDDTLRLAESAAASVAHAARALSRTLDGEADGAGTDDLSGDLGKAVVRWEDALDLLIP